MKKRGMLGLAILFIALAFTSNGWASESGKVKYRAGKTVDFEALLIQGQLKRPEISVVTGNVGDSTDGLLRLRENFLDTMAMDAGEKIK